MIKHTHYETALKVLRDQDSHVKHDSGALLPCSFPTLFNPAALLGVSLHLAMDLESGC